MLVKILKKNVKLNLSYEEKSYRGSKNRKFILMNALKSLKIKIYREKKLLRIIRTTNLFLILNNLFYFKNERIFEIRIYNKSENNFIFFFGQAGVYENLEKLLNLINLKIVKLKELNFCYEEKKLLRIRRMTGLFLMVYIKNFKNLFMMLNSLFWFKDEFIFEIKIYDEDKYKFIFFFGQAGVYENFEKLLNLINLKVVKLDLKEIKNVFYKNCCIISIFLKNIKWRF